MDKGEETLASTVLDADNQELHTALHKDSSVPASSSLDRHNLLAESPVAEKKPADINRRQEFALKMFQIFEDNGKQAYSKETLRPMELDFFHLDENEHIRKRYKTPQAFRDDMAEFYTQGHLRKMLEGALVSMEFFTAFEDRVLPNRGNNQCAGTTIGNVSIRHANDEDCNIN